LYIQRNTSTPDLNSTQVQLEKLEVQLKTPKVRPEVTNAKPLRKYLHQLATELVVGKFSQVLAVVASPRPPTANVEGANLTSTLRHIQVAFNNVARCVSKGQCD
jgi:hypothetical protein